MSALKKKKISAECLNSSMKEADKKRVYGDLRLKTPTTKYVTSFLAGFFSRVLTFFHRLLYVTPELIATEGFKSQLHALNNRGLLSCFAIDEVRYFRSLFPTLFLRSSRDTPVVSPLAGFSDAFFFLGALYF